MALNIRKAWSALFEQPLEQKQEITLNDINNGALRSMLFGPNGDFPGDIGFITASQEAFERNITTYRCIQMVAGGVAGLHWVLKNKNTNEEIETHALLDLLSNPNPLQGKSTFFHNIQADKMLDGNYFIHMNVAELQQSTIIQPAKKPPKELWALRPDMVVVGIGPGRLPTQYDYLAGTMGGKTATFAVDQLTGKSNIIHGMSYAPLRETERGRGLSPVRAAWMAVQTHNEGMRWNRNLLKNGARPSGALVSEDTLNQEQIDGLRSMLDASHTGGNNSGKPFLLGGGLTWQEMSINPKDLDFNLGKDSVARDIATALGVPPTLLHLPGDTAYNNVSEARIALYEETILPEAYALRDDLNRCLVPLYGPNLYLDIDLDCVEALSPRRQEKWTTISNSQFLTINEKRAALGYEPLEGCDEVLIPTTMMPVNAEVEEGELPETDVEEGDDEASKE